MRNKLPFFDWFFAEDGYGGHVLCFLLVAVWIIGFAWTLKSTELKDLQREYFDVMICVKGQQAQPPEPFQQCMETVYDVRNAEFDMANGGRPEWRKQPSK